MCALLLPGIECVPVPSLGGLGSRRDGGGKLMMMTMLMLMAMMMRGCKSSRT
ncbi:hypothetical protein IF1G_02784 [Cordyceps javanica]|uniref:Uncharacterized protein n=1 Tax=Cordyceps javanica TaxID=43265 RepID=A0A545VAE5_9HYPO|nr:hypothetical protein IF1G_02784 [Cordyceps javanica]